MNHLCTLSDKISDKDMIKKILHSVLEHPKQVAILIETLLNLNSGHLRAVEERKKKLGQPPPAHEGRVDGTFQGLGGQV
jgi:hypothetical protein